MGEQLGEVTVVGQHEQAFGLVVEATDGEDARFVRDELDHSRALVAAIEASEIADRATGPRRSVPSMG